LRRSARTTVTTTGWLATRPAGFPRTSTATSPPAAGWASVVRLAPSGLRAAFPRQRGKDCEASGGSVRQCGRRFPRFGFFEPRTNTKRHERACGHLARRGWTGRVRVFHVGSWFEFGQRFAHRRGRSGGAFEGAAGDGVVSQRRIDRRLRARWTGLAPSTPRSTAGLGRLRPVVPRERGRQRPRRVGKVAPGAGDRFGQAEAAADADDVIVEGVVVGDLVKVQPPFDEAEALQGLDPTVAFDRPPGGRARLDRGSGSRNRAPPRRRQARTQAARARRTADRSI
jgi:hypothetical protein